MEGYRGRIAPSTPPCRRSTLRLWRIHCQWNQMYERKRRGRGWGHCCSDFGQFVGSRRALCLHLPTLFNGARSALWHPTSTLQVDPWPEPPWFCFVVVCASNDYHLGNCAISSRVMTRWTMWRLVQARFRFNTGMWSECDYSHSSSMLHINAINLQFRYS